MKQVVISGGTGLLGKHVCQLLLKHKYEPLLLTRNINTALPYKQFLWNPKLQRIDEQVFENVYAIIHLAGTGVADQRWTKAYKNEIVNSRVQSARLIIQTLQEKKINIHAFISASAVGYYGSHPNKTFTETDAPARDFLGQTCVQWEATADEAASVAQHVAKLRIGIVLAKEGGAFKKIYQPMRYGIAGIFGSGHQFYPWIHIDDVANMFVYTLEQNLQGVYNAVAPQHNTFHDIIRAIELSAKRKTLHLPAPKFMLKLALGEFAETLYASQKVSSQKITDAGFRFTNPQLNEAVASLI